MIILNVSVKGEFLYQIESKWRNIGHRKCGYGSIKFFVDKSITMFLPIRETNIIRIVNSDRCTFNIHGSELSIHVIYIHANYLSTC